MQNWKPTAFLSHIKQVVHMMSLARLSGFSFRCLRSSPSNLSDSNLRHKPSTTWSSKATSSVFFGTELLYCTRGISLVYWYKSTNIHAECAAVARQRADPPPCMVSHKSLFRSKPHVQYCSYIFIRFPILFDSAHLLLPTQVLVEIGHQRKSRNLALRDLNLKF